MSKKKHRHPKFDWDQYKGCWNWDDRDRDSNPTSGNDIENIVSEPCSTATKETAAVDTKEDIIRSARSLSMRKVFVEDLDESKEVEDMKASNDAASFEECDVWNQAKSEKALVEDDEEDDDTVVFQGKRPLSLKDIIVNEIGSDFDALVADFVAPSEKKYSEEKATPPPLTVATVQTEPAPPQSPTSIDKPKKDGGGRRQTLQDMQNAIVAQVPLITHNGGLYYYNGRTYKALGSSYELLGLVRSKVSTTAFASTTTKQFFDLLVYLKADDRLTPVHYEARLKDSKHKVVLNNGVLDLESMELHPHSSRYLTFHELDADYVEKKPKVFLRFLEQVGGDSEISRRVAEVVGYLLSSLNHRYFFVAGTAQGSGKSTLGLLLQALVGADQVSSISTHQLDRRFALGSTRNKILNLAMDVPKGHLSSVTVSLIKSITGGDPIEIEEKYQPNERIISNLRFLFGTNYPITVPDSDSEAAFWDRMVILPFTRSVPPHLADLTLLDKLIEEKDEIISYCLRALSHVIANNMQFSPCAVADQMKAEWRNAAIDPRSWEEFFYTYVMVTGQADDSVFAMELYDNYKKFCRDRQYEPVPYQNMRNWITANVPASDCVAKRIHKTGQNPLAGYCGIRFTPSELYQGGE